MTCPRYRHGTPDCECEDATATQARPTSSSHTIAPNAVDNLRLLVLTQPRGPWCALQRARDAINLPRAAMTEIAAIAGLTPVEAKGVMNGWDRLSGHFGFFECDKDVRANPAAFAAGQELGRDLFHEVNVMGLYGEPAPAAKE